MESRLISGEQSNILFDKKGENNSSILSEMVEKLESRVLAMDKHMTNMRNEQGRERDNINQIEFMNLKNNEDFKSMLGGL